MKKLFPIVFLLMGIFLSLNIRAQTFGNITYSDTFTAYSVYCPGSSQYDGWGSWRSKLDTNSFKLMQVNMRGTYSASGRTCSDSFIVRKIAANLKNGTAYTSPSCNGNVWVVSAPGSCSAGGCIILGDNVGLGADGQLNACQCLNPSFQLRPIIGNMNWGGVNSISCSPAPTQRMIVEFSYKLYPDDASISAITPPDICANPNNIIAKIKNSGSNVMDSVRITWSLNNVIQSTNYLTKKIGSNKDTVLILKTGVNFTPYTNYTISVWTWKPNGKKDAYTSNDTFTYKFWYSGTPKTPDARDTVICGSGNITLIGKPANKNDTLIWYGSKIGTTILGVGKYFKTSYLTPGTYKYFVGGAGQLLNKNIQSTFGGGNQQAGFMLDLKAFQTTTIDSIALNIGAISGTSADIEFYYRDSTFGTFESVPSAWKLLGKYTVKSRGIGVPTNIPVKFSIPAGKRYGIYVQTTNAPSFFLKYDNGINTFNDGILSINPPTRDIGGNVIYGGGLTLNWGTFFPSRVGNIRFYYKIPQCVSQRDSMTLEIKRKPTGAELIKGSPFNSPNPGSDGTTANPDIASVGKEVNYEFLPPTGYSNAGHGSLWKITDLRVVKRDGKHVPDNDTSFKIPSSSSNGKIRFTPSASLEDSLITIYTTIKDLAITQCDSTLERIIYVAPTPKVNFSSNTVCFGTPVEFKNRSSITKGNIIYKWDFGNGDSSNLIDPVYLFPKHGVYDVKLTATSDFGIVKDTVIKVVVNEIPDIKFKVINACAGDSVGFVNSTSISLGIVKYKWDLGDGKTSTKNSLRHKYIIEGSYIVTLTAEANGCSNTLSKKAHQFVKPVVNFSTTGNCSKNSITYKNLTTIGLNERFGSYWQFGDGKSVNDANPTHIYDTPGDKIIKYIATSQFGCTDSMMKTITILPSPLAAFTHGATCNVKPVVFINSTTSPGGLTSISYSWDFGDGAVVNDVNPQHNYTILGKKNVVLTAFGNNGCSTSFEKELTILAQPVAKFEAIDACTGTDMIFTNRTTGGGIINYKWRFGDGDSSSVYSPVKKYKVSVASTFNVTLVASNLGGCQDMITLPVNIKETPICGFTFKSSGTGGFEYTFTPFVLSYSFYQWSFEGGGSTNWPIARHKFGSDGKYRVRVFMKNADGCECVDTSQFVTVYHLGTGSVKKNIPITFFPNPNKGSITLMVSDISPEESFVVNIIDMTGRLLHTNKFTGNKNREISYNDLTNGIYTLEVIKRSGERYSAKLNILKSP